MLGEYLQTYLRSGRCEVVIIRCGYGYRPSFDIKWVRGRVRRAAELFDADATI